MEFIILKCLSKSRTNMIRSPDRWNLKSKPLLHRISMEYIEKSTECMEGIDRDYMDCNTCLKMHEVLSYNI